MRSGEAECVFCCLDAQPDHQVGFLPLTALHVLPVSQKPQPSGADSAPVTTNETATAAAVLLIHAADTGQEWFDHAIAVTVLIPR